MRTCRVLSAPRRCILLLSPFLPCLCLCRVFSAPRRFKSISLPSVLLSSFCVASYMRHAVALSYRCLIDSHMSGRCFSLPACTHKLTRHLSSALCRCVLLSSPCLLLLLLAVPPPYAFVQTRELVASYLHWAVLSALRGCLLLSLCLLPLPALVQTTAHLVYCLYYAVAYSRSCLLCFDSVHLWLISTQWHAHTMARLPHLPASLSSTHTQSAPLCLPSPLLWFARSPLLPIPLLHFPLRYTIYGGVSGAQPVHWESMA